MRRATGGTLHQIYEERIRSPFGIDFYLGLPQAEGGRWVDVLPPLYQQQEPNPDDLMTVGFNLNGDSPTDLIEFANTPMVRTLDRPPLE